MANKSVADYYANKCIFLTGGTGFLGKVTIEKLLYSCPEIDKIYMLIREKKGIGIEKRLEIIFNDPLFSRLKAKKPQCLAKVIPIEGDVISPRLGLSCANEETLIKNVSVVIHAAAAVKFNLPLKEAWETNVEGTKMVLTLAQKMMKVDVFLHVSTAYSYSDRRVIEEVLYPAPADIDKIYQLTKQDLTEEETKLILEGRPNTYTFTKALSEHLVAENLVHMSTVIIRPSIVSAIKNDPVKGWLENWNGSTALMVLTSKGLNRVIYGKNSNKIDLIPVDYVVNLIIAAAAKNNRSKHLEIYNCCTSGCNPLNLEKLLEVSTNNCNKQRSACTPCPKLYVVTRCNWLITITTLLLQVLPALVADTFRRIVGKPPIYVNLQSRAIKTRQALDYFTDRSWIMKTDNTRSLFSSLSTWDKQTFPFDPSTIDWTEYLQDYLQGVQQFLENKK